jgi:sugar lactone lactonase YvrE
MARFQRFAVGFAVIVIAFAWRGPTPHAQVESSTVKFVSGWAKMPAAEWEIARVAMDPKGTKLLAFKRSDPPIVEFDPQSGKVLAQWGEGLFTAPHGMYVDREGFLWVTDAGKHGGPSTEGTGLVPPIASGLKNHRGFQVLKFSPEHKLVMVLGKQGVQDGTSQETFGAPSDVIVGNNGDIFVADGHELVETEHPRIMKFTKEGQFIKQWGKKGTGPGEFSVPHAMAIDSRGRLLVADRGNRRIQVFSQDGEFLEQWTALSGGSGLALGLDDTLYTTVGHQLLIGSAKDGSLREKIDDVWAEGVAADAKGNVWVGEVYRRAVKKFTDLGALSPASRR